MMWELFRTICIMGLCGIFTITGYAMGYSDGRKDQKEILLRLRKSIANNQG